MNLLIISCVFPPEPIVSAQLSVDIATELSIRGYTLTVLSPRPTRPLNFEFDHEKKQSYIFKHSIIDSYTSPKSNIIGRFRESYSFGKKCSKYISKNHKDIDVIYQNSWPLFAQFLIVKEARRYGIPIVTHIQDIYPESITNKLPLAKGIVNNILLPIDKYICKHSSVVLCISNNMKETIETTRNVNKKKLQIVSNWHNEDSFIEYNRKHLLLPRDSAPFTFMYLGNNGPVAGVDFLINAFSKAKIPNTRLIIAGSGSKTDYCKELAKTLNASNIYFESVPEGKVPEVQAKADVMLLPVKVGGAMSSIPSKLPAYMFSAKPIIGSLDLESDTARAIKDADCGILVKPENESKLIEAMNEIVNWNNDILVQKGKNGFNYAIDNFSKKINLEKVINIILSVK